MKLLAEPVGSRRRMPLLAATILLAMVAVLAIAAKAQATETIFWDNYEARPPTVAFANVDGSGGGYVNTAGAEIDDPEGMAFDPANGRLYVASSDNNQIVWVAVDGSGAGVLDTGAAPVEDPEGIAVDPSTQTVYWANDGETGSIGYASANGGVGGLLNTGTATVKGPYKVALDTVHGRIYWASYIAMTEGVVSFANLNGTGGADLPLAEGERPQGWSAINVDPATERLYFLGASPAGINGVYWIGTSGVGSGEIDTAAASFNQPFGMAFDPSLGRFYWANYANKESREGAFGTATVNPGGGSGISIAAAPVQGPQDPVILKSPTGTGAPQLTQQVASLSCSQGTWSQDYPGSYVYAAPSSYSYQWVLNGQPIPGATTPTYTATAAGSYTCTVIGTNVSGSASQASAAVTVTAAALKAKLKGKTIRVKAGKTAMVKLGFTNRGELASARIKVCAKLSKKAKKGLKSPKCASLRPIASGGRAVATLRVKTRKSAQGTYKFATSVKGTAVKSVTIRVKVTGGGTAKPKGKKKH